MISSRPRSVAVIIAAYNAGETVAKAVRSALAEPEVAEVWVIDDFSTDDTVARAAACDDGTQRLKVVAQSANRGPAAARNRALGATQCDWVCVLDADDYFLPGRIGRLLSVSEGADMVADELVRVSDAAAPLPEMDPGPLPVGAPLVDFSAFVAGNISRAGRHRRELGFMKPLIRREFLRRHDLTYDGDLRLGEDYHLYAHCLLRGAVLRLFPPAGYVAVERLGSLSGRHSIEDLRALRDCDESLRRVRPLTPGESRLLRSHATGIDKRLQWRRLIEAFKTRNARAALSTLTGWEVTLFLAAKLGEQAWLRTFRGHGSRVSPADPQPFRPVAE